MALTSNFWVTRQDAKPLPSDLRIATKNGNKLNAKHKPNFERRERVGGFVCIGDPTVKPDKPDSFARCNKLTNLVTYSAQAKRDLKALKQAALHQVNSGGNGKKMRVSH